ncbi:steroid alpha reductase family protein [Xylariales sp. PMI_506]|nr:steroid alpha reductase family protein [Xylariales sp. PMI_506]
MAELTIKLSNRSPKQPIKRLPPTLELPQNATVEDAKIVLARKLGIADHNRIGLFDPTTKKTLKNRLAPVAELGYTELLIKDLGPQLGWRTVFLIEYFGPLLFHPLIVAVRSSLYPAVYPFIKDWVPEPNSFDGDLSFSQQLTFWCIMAHFLKREFETAFVHRFSASTMPAFNVFRNSFFYWAVAGLLAALEVYAPFSPAAKATTLRIDALGFALFLFGESANFMVHWYLSTLRSPGGTERKIPKGYGFSLVTSPNYMYEIIAWVGLILISRSPSVALFIVVGSSYMYTWGWGKEKAYRKEFGDKYKKKRYVMLPGLL